MIFVTGATGMLGAHLVYKLVSEGKRVRANYRSEQKKELTRQIFEWNGDVGNQFFNRIDWVQVELDNYPALAECLADVKQVYHTAAIVSFRAADARKMIRNNRVITANLVNAALACNVDSFCHVSSVAALGESALSVTINEETERPTQGEYSGYASSKFESEVEVWRGIAEGLNAVIVNPSIIIGPGDWTSSSTAIFSQVAKGLKYYTDGQAGYIAVADVVNAMCMLMQKRDFGQRYVLNAETISFEKFFGLVATNLQVDAPSKSIGPRLLRTVQALLWLVDKISGIQAAITADMVKSAFHKKHYDSTKFITQHKFIFTPIVFATLF